MSGGSAGASLPSGASWPVMGRAIRQGGEPHWHPPGPLMSEEPAISVWLHMAREICGRGVLSPNTIIEDSGNA